MKDRLLFYTIDTDIISDSNELTRTLVSFATEFGLEGNIWQHWLTYILMTDENPFSLACERMLIREDSTLMQLAAPDLSLFRELMNAEPGVSCTGGRSDLLSLVKDYRSPYDDAAGTAAGRRIMDLSSRLAGAGSEEEFGSTVIAEYEEYGAGVYSLYRAFRVSDSPAADTARSYCRGK